MSYKLKTPCTISDCSMSIVAHGKTEQETDREHHLEFLRHIKLFHKGRYNKIKKTGHDMDWTTGTEQPLPSWF